jgi:hypothetical protein
MSERRVRIPVAQDQIFIGRERDVEMATNALVAADAQGAADEHSSESICVTVTVVRNPGLITLSYGTSTAME